MDFALQPNTTSGERFVALAEQHAADFATRAEQHDREASFPHENIEAMQQTDVMSACVPLELGGLGVESLHDVIIGINRLGRADGSTAIATTMHLLSSWTLTRGWRAAAAAGETAQAERVEAVLRRIPAGQVVLCSPQSEPGTAGKRAVRQLKSERKSERTVPGGSWRARDYSRVSIRFYLVYLIQMPHPSETNTTEAKVALVGRMREWREAQRQKAGGMTALTVWVPSRSAAFLREIFGRLADPGERGSDYRMITSFWTARQRAIGDRFPGLNFSAEIDLPFHGPHWHMRPAGGRVTGSGETWIELTPNEADEVSRLCRKAVSSTLSDWLQTRDLLGKLRDHVGVALNTDFAHPDYPPREGESLIRPKTDAAFEENEAKIAREVEREALQSRRHPTDDPTVVYYEGFHKIPSRCHAVHRRVGDRILFALGHIRHGGTSPTNMIEDLAVEMWKRFYPKDRFDNIEWYDAWPETYPLTDEFRMQRVVLAGNEGDRNGPVWTPARDVPEDFIDEVRRVISPEAKTSTAPGRQLETFIQQVLNTGKNDKP